MEQVKADYPDLYAAALKFLGEGEAAGSGEEWLVGPPAPPVEAPEQQPAEEKAEV